VSNLYAVRKSLVALSRRHSRVPHETEDVAHDVLLSALRRGVAIESETFLRSAHGAVRRHGAFLARSALRRRAREESSAGELGSTDDDHDVEGAPLSALSPALRTTLFLLVLGLDKAELRQVLGVSDDALRKRFQALRDHGPLARPQLAVAQRTPALSRLRRSQVDVLPRLHSAQNEPRRTLGIADPDGHGLIFVEALTRGCGTATTGASEVNARTHAKGSPCSTPSSKTSASSSR
jgi:DNA-directed RNA polymerase specialized sigma24 family protein